MSTQLILLIIGMTILDIAFFSQVFSIWRTKTSLGLSWMSWTINFVGRLIWIIYGMLLVEWGGLVISIGQGICCLVSIPVLYYINRNKMAGGQYIKEHFNLYFFLLRIISVIAILALMVVCSYYGVVYTMNNKSFMSVTNVFIIALFGSAFTGFSFLPQTIKTIKTRSTKSTSLYLCLWFIVGNSLLIAYLMFSMIIHSNKILQYIPAILSTSLSIISMIIIFIIKLQNTYFSNKKN